MVVASRRPLGGPPFERRACATRRPQGGAAGGGARAQGASLGGECVFKPTVSVKWGEISRGEISNSTPRLNVALARLVDLKAALLAETSARGPDGSRMRSPQLARCSRDQLRRRMGQHGAALGRCRGGGCEVSERRTVVGRERGAGTSSTQIVDRVKRESTVKPTIEAFN